jgi:hypothetical protein
MRSRACKLWYFVLYIGMRCFKTPTFTKALAKSDLTDAELKVAMDQVLRGQIDVQLGGGLLKKRVARPNAGKRSGYRTIIAYRDGDRAIFLYMFAKNEKANISRREFEALKALAGHYLGMSQPDLDIAVKQQALIELSGDI